MAILQEDKVGVINKQSNYSMRKEEKCGALIDGALCELCKTKRKSLAIETHEALERLYETQ